MIPSGYDARKNFPLLTVLSAYFPDAIEALVELCIAGQAQHAITVPKDNPFYIPGDRLAWDRSKSTEEMETLMRHAWDHMRAKRAAGGAANLAMYDTDGVLHIVKAFWRAGAEAQKTIEALRVAPAPALAVRCPECGAHGGAHFGTCSGVGI
jgi:hypothetical protein